MNTHTCGDPRCSVPVPWQKAFCYRHWLGLPEAERRDQVKRVLDERKETT